MIRKTTLFAFAAALLALAASGAAAAVYEIDPAHSSVGFEVRHMMVSKVRGQFDKFSGALEYEAGKPQDWKASVTIDAASINTNNDRRNGHLKSPDFFDVEQYPEITFVSTGVKPEGDRYVMSGNLTMHGVTKPIDLDVEFNGEVIDPRGNERVGFSATGELNRYDYGIMWNAKLDKGGVTVGEDVKIMIEVEAVKKPE